MRAEETIVQLLQARRQREEYGEHNQVFREFASRKQKYSLLNVCKENLLHIRLLSTFILTFLATAGFSVTLYLYTTRVARKLQI